MPTCPCGCGRPLTVEEYIKVVIKEKKKKGFAASMTLNLAQMTDKERDEILENAPKEFLDALDIKCVSSAKRPEQIFAEADLAGKNAQVQKLYGNVISFFDADAKSVAEIKKLKKGRKKDQVRIEKLVDENQSLKRQLKVTSEQQKISAGIAVSRKKGIENLQTIVVKKNAEILRLKQSSVALIDLHDAISSIDTSGNEDALAEAISNLIRIVSYQKSCGIVDSENISSDVGNLCNMSVEDVGKLMTG